MASVTARLSVLGESGYGEKEQDANSALTELDKGLRSGKSGEQCEAIVRFPRLFEKYPFPILINSAFLKLGDVFRVGNNFLRLCVLKVTQQSQKHLDKILNLDEFVRRIYAVIHSNDPLARALTLRTLGSIACSIPEKKNVHHVIRNSLDSHDAVELEAAIYATEKFASFSKTFASNICGKIVEMIEGLETPIDMKLRLIPIFQHMHSDVSLATMVRNLCTELLPTCPAQKMVLVTLSTITKLTTAALINVTEQISLLFLYLESDPRRAVKITSLNNLRFLAQRLPHIWNEDNINKICKFALESPYKPLKHLSLDLLVILAKSVAVQKFEVASGSFVLTLCETLSFSDDAAIAAKAVELQSQLALYSYREGHLEGEFDIFHESILATESLLLTMTSKPYEPSIKSALKMVLCCAASLCEADSNVSHQFVDSIGSLVTNASGETTVFLCEALASIANRKAGVLNPLFYNLLKALSTLIDKDNKSHSKQDKQTVVMLFVLLFQTSKDNINMVKELEPTIGQTIANCDPWMCYKIGRQAARYGNHCVAARIFHELTNRVCSEHLHFWLIGLWELSSGESKLCSTNSSSSGSIDYIDRLSECVSHYLRGLSALRAATTPSHTLQFQCEYARLRSEMIQAHAQLFHVCNCYKLSPPPAIAAALAAVTRDELDRCGRISTQLRKSVKEFRSVGEMYGKLCQTYFDVDPFTLTNILILQQSCYLMAHAIETIALKSQNMGFINSEDEVAFDISLGLPKQAVLQSVEIQGMINANLRAFSIIQEIMLQTVNKVIAHEHIQALIEMSQILTEVSICYPRFFFQSLQSTNIKLAISPQPRVAGEPILIQNGAHLVLKVEGIVQHVSRTRQFRAVRSIVINATSQPQVRPIVGFETKATHEFNNSMSRTVEPHNDYFSAQFLLAFNVAGIHVIVVEVAILDDKGELWTTGPRSVLTAKFFDDPSNHKSHNLNRPGVSGRF
ncbi:hypothetical protein CHUAL_012262 [Chamberlinius hualienensis]